MIIEIVQEGGFAGMSKHMKIDTDNINKEDQAKLKKLLNTSIYNEEYSSKKKLLKGAADYYTYRITIREGAQERVIQCPEYDMRDDLRNLIGYVRRYSKRPSTKS